MLQRHKGKRRQQPTAPPPLDSSWQGLPRYRSTLDAEFNDPSHLTDYAKVTTLLVTPQLQIVYYCDTAGAVPPDEAKAVTGLWGLETFDIGNGDLSPEWGVDVVIKGGNLTYGPWADRQRTALQKVFTPTTFNNYSVTPKLRPGDERMHTALKVFVEFSDRVTLRIPTREASKVRWTFICP